jgi:hypothetical protein
VKVKSGANFAVMRSGEQGDGVGELKMARTGWFEGRIAGAGVTRIAAAIALTCLAVLAIGVMVVFAAAVALTAAIAGALLAVSSMFLRNRRAAGSPQFIEARKVGHAWIAYGLDQRAR